MEKILVASHIVPWKESNEEERLDVANGILLSPNLDALFDRHLISFTDTGDILISAKLQEQDFLGLGLNRQIKLRTVFDDMTKYLDRHRKVFHELEKS